METPYDLLCEVLPGRETWKFKVRVVRLWPVYSFLKPGEINGLEMVLIDEKGGKIHASIRKQLLYLFDKKIKEGDVYKLSHFAVAPSVGAYRPTLHPYKLIFQMKTKIQICESPGIPLFGFSFTELAVVSGYDADFGFLIDVIGVMTGISSEREYVRDGKVIKMVVIELTDESGKCECALFGEYVDELQRLIGKNSAGCPVVAIQFAKVKIFREKASIQNVNNATRILVNPKIEEADALKKGLAVAGIPASSSIPILGPLPIVIALAAQGTFRGFKDTKTPLYAVGAGNFLNVILDPILIFLCGLGISGAAIATVISEFLIAFILLWNLSGKVLLIPFDFDGTKFFSYLKSGGLLIARTLAVFITMTLTTSLAANQGPIPMAGHQICMQVWLSISLLTDALALAGQALLASSYSLGNYEQARLIIYRVIQIGLGAGITLSMILFVGFGPFSSLFSTDSEVLDVARSGIWFVAGSQPVNALAFVIDGIYYGVSDFEYAAYSMVLVGLISSIFMLVATPVVGLPGVWTGLFLFMMLRVLAGVWRLSSKSGPWDMVWYKDGAED